MQGKRGSKQANTESPSSSQVSRQADLFGRLQASEGRTGGEARTEKKHAFQDAEGRGGIPFPQVGSHLSISPSRRTLERRDGHSCFKSVESTVLIIEGCARDLARRYYADYLRAVKGYCKPVIEKASKMTFPIDIISGNGRNPVCKQCSSCHTCR